MYLFDKPIFDKPINPDSIDLYIIQIMIIFILAFPAAVLDIKFHKYRKANQLNIYTRLFIIILQLLIGIIYIYIINKCSPKIADTFQTTLPGMYFGGIFYSLQYNLFTDLHDIVQIYI